MYEKNTYIWAIFGLNVSTYSIHGASGIVDNGDIPGFFSFDIAVEDGSFIDDLPIIHGDFHSYVKLSEGHISTI